jgi:uncharacterized protein (DUF433 family)
MVKLAFDPAEVALGLELRDQPRYSPNEAAGYLGIPSTTIGSWFFGTTYGPAGNKVDFEPVLIPADREARLLSFDNLVEAYVLRCFRTKDKINLREISAAMKRARDAHGIRKPLLDRNLLKLGKALYLEDAGQVLGLSEPSQLLLPNALELFSRVVYKDDAICALFPLTRPVAEDSPRMISISPEFSFGRPIIDRSKVQTSIVAARYLNGDSMSELAADYRCDVSEIEESIRAEWMFARGQKIKAA